MPLLGVDTGGPPPPVTVDNFLTGANPTLISVFFNTGFGATVFGLLGVLYVCPLGRRAFLERIDISVNLAATIAGGGQLFVDQIYGPAAGASQPMKVMDIFEGDGPGTMGLIEPFGHMLPGDSIFLNLTAISIGSGGNFFRSAFHGIEYDE